MPDGDPQIDIRHFSFCPQITPISRIGEHRLVRTGLALPVGFRQLAETIFEEVRDPCAHTTRKIDIRQQLLAHRSAILIYEEAQTW